MQKYEELQCIGRGSYGSAHLVCLKGTKEKYVVKKIPMELLTEKEKDQAFREVELLSKLKHPNVVEYKENFVVGNVIHIVMAYCDGGDLAGKIRDRVKLRESGEQAYFDIGQILDWFVQMAMAIKYLHEQRILHRDLKTSNIFLTTENVVKLGDFGIAKSLDSTFDQAKTVVGTPYYMSPEVCESKPYSYASDIWSLGCVLYEMCALKHAFDAPNILTLILKIVQHEFAAVPAHYDKEISDILRRLLDKCPEKRPTMEQIFLIPYIRNHMQGLVALGGSLVMNQVVRRPFGIAKRRVHAKNVHTRRSSCDLSRRKSRVAASSQSSSQWAPITPFDTDEYELGKQDDLVLLEASIMEESQLVDFRLPERSTTPEPLVCAQEEIRSSTQTEQVALNIPPANSKVKMDAHYTAWMTETVNTSVDDSAADGDEEVEEDVDSRLQAEAEELMNPNFENEYSEECMDSLQIYYGSSQPNVTKHQSNGRFRIHHQLRKTEQVRLTVDTHTANLRRAKMTEGCSDDESELRPRRFAFGDPSVVSPTNSYEQWGNHLRQKEETLTLSIDDSASLDAENGDPAPLSESGILRELEIEAQSSCDESGDEGYSSVSDYEAEENFYSDDSDFFEENETEYSEDFDASDAEFIDYTNDEFVGEEEVDLVFPKHQQISQNTQVPGVALSPSLKRQQKAPPPEVQWVVRNVAQSLLESYDDLAVA